MPSRSMIRATVEALQVAKEAEATGPQILQKIVHAL
jgi:hypothetical protein